MRPAGVRLRTASSRGPVSPTNARRCVVRLDRARRARVALTKTVGGHTNTCAFSQNGNMTRWRSNALGQLGLGVSPFERRPLNASTARGIKAQSGSKLGRCFFNSLQLLH